MLGTHFNTQNASSLSGNCGLSGNKKYSTDSMELYGSQSKQIQYLFSITFSKLITIIDLRIIQPTSESFLIFADSQNNVWQTRQSC